MSICGERPSISDIGRRGDAASRVEVMRGSAFRTSTCRGWFLEICFKHFITYSKVDMWLMLGYIYICPYVRTKYMYIHMGPYLSLIVICLLWNLTKY